MKKVRFICLAALAIAALVLTACGSSKKSSTASSSSGSSAPSSGAIKSNPANAKVTITVGSKNFTEQKVLGDIYAEALKAAGYNVKTSLNLGDENTALRALKGHQIDAYPEYTGTALLSFFGVKTSALPHDANVAYQQVKSRFAPQGIVAFPPTPFTSSNEVGLMPAEDKKLGGITQISQLTPKAPSLTLYGTPECRTRTDCLLGLEQVYKMHFKKFVPVAPDLRHTVLENGQADVSIVFTTDPQNKTDKVVLLKDDKHMFPPYNSTLLARTDVVTKAGPDLAKVVALVNKGLTAAVMQELNARVDLDKKTPEEVAHEYLTEQGLI